MILNYSEYWACSLPFFENILSVLYESMNTQSWRALCFKFLRCPAVIGVIWNWSVNPKRAITIPQQLNHFYSTLTSNPTWKRDGKGLIAKLHRFLYIFI